MKSLDTNVLARFFISDPDDAQAIKQQPAAIAAMSSRAFVGVTVLLEFEWVMRGFYGLSRPAISKVFDALLGIEHLTIEDRAAVIVAINGFNAGLDFADSMHVSRSAQSSGFVTFDQKLVKRSKAVDLQVQLELIQ